MKLKLIIYRGSDKNIYVDEAIVDGIEGIERMLEQYEGFWCRVIDMSTEELILEGAFDEDFLDETYYQEA